MSWRTTRGPERIVCLTEEPTEILYALGEDHRIVGISAYTERPPEAKRDKPVVSAFIGGSVDKIRALEPDLVIGFSDVQATLARDLISANLQVLIFNQRSLQEILDVVLALGRLVAAEARAEALVAHYIRRLVAAQERTASAARRPVVYFEEWYEPRISAIAWVSELVELAGGRNPFAHLSVNKASKDRVVTDEQILEAAPEVVLASWCGKPFDAASFAGRPGYEAVPAVWDGRLHEVDASIILQPGPACLTDGLDALESVIRGC